MAPPMSWLKLDPRSPFSLANIPFGIISSPSSPTPRVAIAIGRHALDLRAFSAGNGFSQAADVQTQAHVFAQPTLNAFAALGRPFHRTVRTYLQGVLQDQGPHPELLERNDELQQEALVPLQACTMHLPMTIGDYTDFYAGLNHAYNVGVMFRGPQNALQPNYKHLPVGYHGRASSIVVSETPIRRPNGQILSETKTPQLAPCKKLDMELELGCFVCKENKLGEPVAIEQAPEHLFGVVLMNDWSARDIQAWEYVPLGPFNSKNFGTTISPWVVLMDALSPHATHGLDNDVLVQRYMDEGTRQSHYAIQLSVDLTTSSGSTTTVTKTSAQNLLFSFPQMLAHHTVGGCPFKVGDLMGSGTISGTEAGQKGSLLEQSENGKTTIELAGGEKRVFLDDGDTVTFRGVCGADDYSLVGFGTCVGQIAAAPDV